MHGDSNLTIECLKLGNVLDTNLEWIGGDIRADGWAYACPGNPELAAEFAYRDAYLSHRYSGIYGTMFMAAAISSAFACNDPIEACKIALTEIPKNYKYNKLHSDHFPIIYKTT